MRVNGPSMIPPILHILHVEDEPDIREITKIALESTGDFTVEACSSGEEALRRSRLFTPDLMLLDVLMPGMDGPATLAGMRKMPRLMHTPAVFMTAKILESEIDYYKRAGAFDVIEKPFDPIALPGKVMKIWRTYNA